MNLKLEKIYKNWAVHNLIGHPLMQIFYMINMRITAKYVHDKTLPVYEEKSKQKHIDTSNV